MDNGTKLRNTLAPCYPLTILFVEDNPDDVELSLRVLSQAQFAIRYHAVKTAEEFLHQIRTCYYDIILADYNLGPWTGLDALHLIQKEGRDIPFILVTGALGDERAIECIKSGITDYVLKDHLNRLTVAISRALEERELLEEHRRAERALRESEAKFRMLAESIPAATFIEQGTVCRYVNRAAENITGFSSEELLSMNFWELVLPASRKAVMGQCMPLGNYRSPSRYVVQIRTKRREIRWLDVTVGMFQLEGGLAALITAFDITDRRRHEHQIRKLSDGCEAAPDGTHLNFGH
jgi:two-component system cell cycle sensor histidine kinase/response regulator CckA